MTTTLPLITVDTDNAVIRVYLDTRTALEHGLSIAAASRLLLDAQAIAAACSRLSGATFRVENVGAAPAADEGKTHRYFTAADAPADPFTGAREAGWYWLQGGEWRGPAQGGYDYTPEQEARRYAAQGGAR